jgi:hypothetical protein
MMYLIDEKSLMDYDLRWTFVTPSKMLQWMNASSDVSYLEYVLLQKVLLKDMLFALHNYV